MVVTGTPEEVAKVAGTYTGHDLKQLLDRRGPFNVNVRVATIIVLSLVMPGLVPGTQ